MYLRIASTVALCICVTLPATAGEFDWPQWRGPARDNVSRDSSLPKVWPQGGPDRRWLFENAGSGYSGPAIADGRLFVLGTRDDREVLLALDATTGEELWVRPIGDVLENNWGDGPRSTPTVDGDRVYVLGGRGDLVCFQADSGRQQWSVSLTELGGRIPGWGYCESPLVDGDQVVCTPGGNQGAIVAFDKLTGEIRWRSTDFTDGAQYASIIVATPHGQPQYIQLTMNHVVGISPDDGSVLWTSEWPGATAVIPTPIAFDNHIFVTSGYGVGCKLIRIEEGNQVETVYRNRNMKNHHGGVVLWGDHLYGFSDGVGWVCLDRMTGEIVWNYKRNDIGKGAVTCVDGMLYLLTESEGRVVLAGATPDGFSPRSSFQLQPQSEIRSPSGRIWTHPVVANGRLYLRDQEFIACFDLRD